MQQSWPLWLNALKCKWPKCIFIKWTFYIKNAIILPLLSRLYVLFNDHFALEMLEFQAKQFFYLSKNDHFLPLFLHSAKKCGKMFYTVEL